MYKRFILLLLLCTSMSVTAEQPVNIFTSGTYAQLLAQRGQQPFMLVLWSLECPPCYKELAILGELMQTQPALDLVLVSTDTTSDINEIQQKLNKFKLSHASAWVFDHEAAQKLRYEIDPNWYGELPRSYLFDSQHNRQVNSGILSPTTLKRWTELLLKQIKSN